MPAIQIPRLKMQISRLMDDLDRPNQFVRSLYELMEKYSNRIFRHGQSGEPPPLVDWYNVPPPLIKILETELIPFAEREPEKTLNLCDILWAEPFLEFRLIAASLLGNIAPTPPEPIVDRVQRWAKPEEDERILKALIDQGCARIIKENPEYITRQIERWLTDSRPSVLQLGLRATISLVNNPEFENLPALFTLIAPFIRDTPAALREHALRVVKALAHRSPAETSYILSKYLEVTNRKDVAWMIRQSLDEFPAELQQQLRDYLRITKADMV